MFGVGHEEGCCSPATWASWLSAMRASEAASSSRRLRLAAISGGPGAGGASKFGWFSAFTGWPSSAGNRPPAPCSYGTADGERWGTVKRGSMRSDAPRDEVPQRAARAISLSHCAHLWGELHEGEEFAGWTDLDHRIAGSGPFQPVRHWQRSRLARQGWQRGAVCEAVVTAAALCLVN